MVLNRAALEKLNKEELTSLLGENDEKLNRHVNNLTNRLAEINKSLERIESQSEILKTISSALEKLITSLEKQCWGNEPYFWHECLEIVRIPDSTNETKVCELIEKVTGINVNPDCLELCHLLPSDKKNHS